MNNSYEIAGIFKYEMLGETKPVYGVQLDCVRFDNSVFLREVTLLAKNKKGIRNIYKLLSLNNNKEFSNLECPHVSYEEIRENREGIIVGMECTNSDLYQVWVDDEQDHEGEKTKELISKEYDIADFVLIHPWGKYVGMMGDYANVMYPEEVAIKWLLNEMVVSLETVNKYAIAANIIGVEEDLTIEEMIDEYSQPEGYREKCFGPEMARKIVLGNPKALASLIENLSVEEVVYEYKRNRFHKKLEGNITEEGIRKFNDDLNEYIGDEPSEKID